MDSTARVGSASRAASRPQRRAKIHAGHVLPAAQQLAIERLPLRLVTRDLSPEVRE